MSESSAILRRGCFQGFPPSILESAREGFSVRPNQPLERSPEMPFQGSGVVFSTLDPLKKLNT